MAEGKTNQELLIELELRKLLKNEREIQSAADNIKNCSNSFTLGREDLVKGIILREILGPPKAIEGSLND